MADSYLTLNLELPESFLDELDATINDEIKIAQKKWKLRLTEDQKNIVFDNARIQTRLKTSTVARQPWDLGSKLVLRVPFTQNSQINLRPSAKTNRKIELTLTKDGWVIAEDSENPVPVSELLDKQQEIIKRWARTAAFYGVGSYSK